MLRDLSNLRVVMAAVMSGSADLQTRSLLSVLLTISIIMTTMIMMTSIYDDDADYDDYNLSVGDYGDSKKVLTSV